MICQKVIKKRFEEKQIKKGTTNRPAGKPQEKSSVYNYLLLQISKPPFLVRRILCKYSWIKRSDHKEIYTRSGKRGYYASQTQRERI